LRISISVLATGTFVISVFMATSPQRRSRAKSGVANLPKSAAGCGENRAPLAGSRNSYRFPLAGRSLPVMSLPMSRNPSATRECVPHRMLRAAIALIHTQ